MSLAGYIRLENAVDNTSFRCEGGLSSFTHVLICDSIQIAARRRCSLFGAHDHTFPRNVKFRNVMIAEHMISLTHDFAEN